MKKTVFLLLSFLLFSVSFASDSTNQPPHIDNSHCHSKAESSLTQLNGVLISEFNKANDGIKIQSQKKILKGVCLHWVQTDEPLASKGTILLIHGVPQFWYMWRKMIAPLYKKGYRIIVPDLRGYNLSARPSANPLKNQNVHKQFSSLAMAGDSFEILRLLEPQKEKRIVVGHDLGGLVAWEMATRPEYTQGLQKIVIISGGIPVVWRKLLVEEPTANQYNKSWYTRMFGKLPNLSTFYFKNLLGVKNGLDDFLRVRKEKNNTAAKEGTFSDREIEIYAEVLLDGCGKFDGKSCNLKNMMIPYKAFFTVDPELNTHYLEVPRRWDLIFALKTAMHFFFGAEENVPSARDIDFKFESVKTPMKVIYGDQDGFLTAESFSDLNELRRYEAQPGLIQSEIIEGSHWLPEESPLLLTEKVIQFVESHSN